VEGISLDRTPQPHNPVNPRYEIHPPDSVRFVPPRAPGERDTPGIALTICIPTYRRPSLVVRSIRSAIDSSEAWADAVELVVSDNSPELTSETCKAELSRWPGRALYFGNVPSIGMVPNLNQCIAHASGRYVLLLHDDDYLLPSGTSAILAATQDVPDPDPVLLFGVQVVDAEGRVRRHQFFKEERLLSPAEALIRLLSDPSFVRAPAIVVRRDIFDIVGILDPTAGNPNDFDMSLRIASRFGIRCLPSTISAYSVHEAAETTRSFTAQTVRRNVRLFERAAALGPLPAHIVRACEADWFCQFFLAGVTRRLSVEDRQGASEIMALFNLPEIRALEFSPVCLLARFGMRLLVSTPAAMSGAVARWLQYHGAWSRWLQRFRRMPLSASETDRSQACEAPRYEHSPASLTPKDLR
jgi:GT2 family glycosyltransferase